MQWFPTESIAGLGTAGSAAGVVERFRDLLLTRVGESTAIVVACDSSGAIGPKPNDHLQWTGRDAGRTATKVPVMEVLAAGATPIMVVDNLCVEMDPTGQDILRGVMDVCEELAQLPAVTGSDETNMPTIQTGIGITVIGVLERDRSRLASSVAGDVIYAIGLPLGGADGATPNGSPDAASVTTVRSLLEHGGVHEILPVGSKGIRYEMGELARTADLEVIPRPDSGIDLDRSAGASAVVLVSIPADVSLTREDVGGLPCTRVGQLVAPADG